MTLGSDQTREAPSCQAEAAGVAMYSSRDTICALHRWSSYHQATQGCYNVLKNGFICGASDKLLQIGHTLATCTHRKAILSWAGSKAVQGRGVFPIALVRPHLGVLHPALDPQLRKDMDQLDQVQKRATKNVRMLSTLPTRTRLENWDWSVWRRL